MNFLKTIKNTNKAYLASIVLISVFLLYRGINFLDPDFGWHLMTGKLILTSGFPNTDPFSYTMPTFPFVNHEWLNDVVVAGLFSSFGWVGLSFLFVLFCITTIMLCMRKDLPGYCTSMLFILGIASLEPFFDISPRVFSWLFFAIIIYFVLNREVWKKYWWTIPPIILLWVNLHGSFPLGIIVLTIVFVVRSLSAKRVQLRELLVSVVSLLVSFVNPYGYKLWWLVWLTVSDSSMKSRIFEWQPTLISLNTISLLIFFLVAISSILIYKYWRKFSPEGLFLNVFFFIFALTAVRNVPFWVIVDLPMIGMGISYFLKDLKKIKDAKKKFLKASRAAFVLSAVLLAFQFGYTVFRISIYFNEDAFYPSGAVGYLLHNIPTGQIFSEYNWGGYLVWRLPQKKVFINGLMPVWKSQIAPKGESKNVMDDYINITAGNADFNEYFKKYGVDTALLAKPLKKNGVQNYIEKSAPILYNFNPPSGNLSFGKKLESNGWKIVYQDSTAIIYQR